MATRSFLCILTVQFSLIIGNFCGFDVEPKCSKYDFEEKLLEKMVRMEHATGLLKDQFNEHSSQVKDELQTMKEKTAQLQLETTGEQNRLMDLIQECTQKSSAEEKHIAFTAYNSKHLDGLGSEATIIFDSVETNVGQAYKPETGLFTCPYTGHYFFTHSVLTMARSHVETEIVRDGVPKAILYGRSSTGYDQGSNSVILYCEEGQHVWVRIHDSAGSSLHGGRYSQFSGYLIWTD